MSSRRKSRKRETEPDALALLPCVECKAKCCRYVAVEIDKPTTKRDYDQVRWYLLHEHMKVFVDHDNDWFLEFETVCEELKENALCGVYETRPQICRDHGWPTGTCEHFDDPYLHCWSTATEFEAWLDEEGIDWRWKRRPKQTMHDEG